MFTAETIAFKRHLLAESESASGFASNFDLFDQI